MNTHTIRYNKDGLGIVKFRPCFLKKIMESEDYAITAMCQKMKADLNFLTGQNYSLDWEQSVKIKEYADSVMIKCNDITIMNKRIIDIFLRGYMIQPITDIEEGLEMVNHFIRKMKPLDSDD